MSFLKTAYLLFIFAIVIVISVVFFFARGICSIMLQILISLRDEERRINREIEEGR